MIPRPIAKHLDGFRGSFLLIVSGPWFLIGLSYLAITTPGRNAAFSYLPVWMNENELGFAWIISAAFLVACAALGKRHPKYTTIGFIGALLPPVVWSLIFLGALFNGAYDGALASVLLYGTFAAVIYYCSGWPNPARPDTVGGP